MMNETTISQSPTTYQYFVQKGGICRSLELVLLISVEICLGVGAALESHKGLFHQIIVAFPIGTILILILCHLILGPHESWPHLRCCSWAKVETAHDIIMFAMLLPSSLALLVPPFTQLEMASAVLTLVMVLLVALQGVDNFHKVRQHRRSPPLVTNAVNVGMSVIRRQRRKNAPNTPSSFSPRLIPCSTPVCKAPGHRSLSPQSAQFSRHGSDCTSLHNKRLDSNEVFISRESPVRRNLNGGPESPSSGSFNCGTLSALGNKTFIVNNNSVESMCSLSKSPPGFASRINKSFSPTSKVLSPSPKLSKKAGLDVHGLTMISKSTNNKENASKAKQNLKSSFVKVPMINLIQASPELKFPLKKRINESEMGSSPLLQESETIINAPANQNSPLLYGNVFTDLESPSTVCNVITICAFPTLEDSVRSNPRDALIEELGKRFSVDNSLKSKKSITTLKSLDEFSPPKIFFNDSNKQGISALPQPTPRQSIKVKIVTPSKGPHSSPQAASEVSPYANACPSPHTKSGLPALPVLPTDYVRVYPTPQPFMRSLSSTLALSRTLPNTTQDQDEIKPQSLCKTQSVATDTMNLAEYTQTGSTLTQSPTEDNDHYYENSAELVGAQPGDESTDNLLETKHTDSPARKLTPYHLLKNVALTSQTVQRAEGITPFRGEHCELLTEL